MQTQQTEAELMQQFREFMASRQAAPPGPPRLPSDYHGPIDTSYVRPPGCEFPKMVYRKDDKDPRGYRTRIVESQREQDGLPKGWACTTAEIHALLDPIAKAPYKEPEEVEEVKVELKDSKPKGK